MTSPPAHLLARWRPSFERFAFLVNASLRASPGVVTSWWRSRERNAAVGGAALSQHLLGFAVDVVAQDPSAFASAARSRGLFAVVEGDHVHVQAFAAGQLPPSIYSLV